MLELCHADRRRLELLLPHSLPNPPNPLLFSSDSTSSVATACRLSQVSGSVVGYGLARHAGCAVLDGPAQPENQPIELCLGRWPGTKPSPARPGRHDVPCRPDPHRAYAVPGQAGPMDIYTRRGSRTFNKDLAIILQLRHCLLD